MSRYRVFIDTKPMPDLFDTLAQAADSINRQDLIDGKKVYIHDRHRYKYWKWSKVELCESMQGIEITHVADIDRMEDWKK